MEYTKTLATIVYDALSIEYELGTKGKTSIGELLKPQREALTFGIEPSSAIDKAQEQLWASEVPIEVRITRFVKSLPTNGIC